MRGGRSVADYMLNLKKGKKSGRECGWLDKCEVTLAGSYRYREEYKMNVRYFLSCLVVS